MQNSYTAELLLGVVDGRTNGRTDGRNDGPMDRQTDMVTYRSAITAKKGDRREKKKKTCLCSWMIVVSVQWKNTCPEYDFFKLILNLRYNPR